MELALELLVQLVVPPNVIAKMKYGWFRRRGRCQWRGFVGSWGRWKTSVLRSGCCWGHGSTIIVVDL